MKKFNKSLAITLILSLCLTLAAPVDAKSKVRLNLTKATLSVGGSINLKLLNNKKKVTWKSSNKKVASVTKKGKVKAKKKGKASIVAKVGKKKYTCKVTVGKVSKKSTSKKNTSKKNTKNVKKTAVPTATPEFGFAIDTGIDTDVMKFYVSGTSNARPIFANPYSKELASKDQVIWSSSDESIAKIQLTDDPFKVIVIAEKAGECDITLTMCGVTKSAHVTVSAYKQAASSYLPF